MCLPVGSPLSLSSSVPSSLAATPPSPAPLGTPGSGISSGMNINALPFYPTSETVESVVGKWKCIALHWGLNLKIITWYLIVLYIYRIGLGWSWPEWLWCVGVREELREQFKFVQRGSDAWYFKLTLILLKTLLEINKLQFLCLLKEGASSKVLLQSTSQDPSAALLLSAPLHPLLQSGSTHHHSFLLICLNPAKQKVPS